MIAFLAFLLKFVVLAAVGLALVAGAMLGFRATYRFVDDHLEARWPDVDDIDREMISGLFVGFGAVAILAAAIVASSI
jgi:hypothetical protein